jgi:hypothetical protein
MVTLKIDGAAYWMPRPSAQSRLRRGMTSDNQFSASSSIALSWAWCFDIKPVAVAAEAARPA